MGIIKEEFYKRLKEDEEIEKLSQMMESLYEDSNKRLLTIFQKIPSIPVRNPRRFQSVCYTLENGSSNIGKVRCFYKKDEEVLIDMGNGDHVTLNNIHVENIYQLSIILAEAADEFLSE